MRRIPSGAEVIEPNLVETMGEPIGIKTPPANHWTQKELETFLTLYHKRATYREISRKTGRGMNSITNKVYALGLHRVRYKGWIESELATLIRMKLQKKPNKEIAKKLNRTLRSVNSKIQTLGLSEESPNG